MNELGLHVSQSRSRLACGTDRGRIRRHVFPLLSTRPIRDVSQGELREVVESLDGTVLDGVFSWRTAQKLWRCDLRATGITWEALAGTDPPEIQLRSGHERCATTQ